MIVKKWEDLPLFMRTDAVAPYFEILRKRWFGLTVKRVFDILASLTLLLLFMPLFVGLSLLIKLDSPGPVFYRQERVPQFGKQFMRRNRLDEIPQLLNILRGEMTFVGTRPEVPRYVDQYSEEMESTLLLPAGVTSKASIEFKDEERLLSGTLDVDSTYLHEVLPKKMQLNLEYEKAETLGTDFLILLQTILSMVSGNKKDSKGYRQKSTLHGQC